MACSSNICITKRRYLRNNKLFKKPQHIKLGETLTVVAEERSRVTALLIIPQSALSWMHHAVSRSIRLTGFPVPERRHAVIGPDESVFEKPHVGDSSCGNQLLDLTVLLLVPHADQLCVILSAVPLCLSPGLQLINQNVFAVCLT